MKKIGEIFCTIERFFTRDIWEINPAELSSRWKARFVKDIRLIMEVLKNFANDKVGFQSVALCYFCMMAAVPFIAVCFALTGGLGLEGYLTQLLYANFGSHPDVIAVVMNAADNIIASAQKGGFGLISSLMFVWLVIWMMMRVEKVFNNVWGVKKSRSFFAQLGIDLAILILAPFVIVIFFSGSIVYSNILDLLVTGKVAFSDSIKSLLSWVIFFAVVVLVLSAMYKFIPTAFVQYRFAFKAAIFAGLAFTGLQYLYLETQLLVTRLNGVYGTVAAIPLFMLWLRYGWLIILYGAEFSHSFQTNESL